jgi:hypothetical protein
MAPHRIAMPPNRWRLVHYVVLKPSVRLCRRAPPFAAITPTHA